jgi:hypothetical protein
MSRSPLGLERGILLPYTLRRLWFQELGDGARRSVFWPNWPKRRGLVRMRSSYPLSRRRHATNCSARTTYMKRGGRCYGAQRIWRTVLIASLMVDLSAKALRFAMPLGEMLVHVSVKVSM